MIREIIKKEIYLNLLSRKFVLIFILCMVVIISSTLISIKDYEFQMKNYYERLKYNYDLLEKYLPDYESLKDSGINVYKPPTVTSIFVRGVEDDFGKTASVSRYTVPELGEGVRDSPLFVIFEPVDFLYIVKIILSLLVVIFSYTLVSGEKEKGLLRMQFSNSLSRIDFLVGRFMGSFITFCIPFLISTFTALLILSFHSSVQLTETFWLRIISVIAVFFLFIGVCYSLSTLISTLTRKSVNSLFYLLLIWIMMIVVIPDLAPLLGKIIYPVQDFAEMSGEKDLVLYEASVKSGKEISQEARRIKGSLSLEFIMSVVRENARTSGEKIQKIEEKYNTKLNSQVQLIKIISRVSPASSLTFAIMRLANTGLARQKNFISQVYGYKSSFLNFVDSIKNPFRKIEYSAIPEFKFKEEEFIESLSGVLPDIIILSGFFIVFLFLSFIVFLKYDLR